MRGCPAASGRTDHDHVGAKIIGDPGELDVRRFPPAQEGDRQGQLLGALAGLLAHLLGQLLKGFLDGGRQPGAKPSRRWGGRWRTPSVGRAPVTNTEELCMYRRTDL
jgi:hypothetical protein